MSDAHDRPHAEATLSAQQLAAAANISLERLSALVHLGLVEPAEAASDVFPAAAAARLRRMIRLRADLGISFLGAAIVVDLLERIDRLEGRRP
jgi:chaperone modulatory protein CbpM